MPFHEGIDKRDRGGTAGAGEESSTTAIGLTNPGSMGPRADSTYPEPHPIGDLK